MAGRAGYGHPGGVERASLPLVNRGVRISIRLPPRLYPEASLFEIPLGSIQSLARFLAYELPTIFADRRAADVSSTICQKSSVAQGYLGR